MQIPMSMQMPNFGSTSQMIQGGSQFMNMNGLTMMNGPYGSTMTMGRKKRSPQFWNGGSQVGQQIDQSTRFNFGPMPKMDWSNPPRFPAMAGGVGSTFTNIGSQIGQQFGRKKRSAQFNNLGVKK